MKKILVTLLAFVSLSVFAEGAYKSGNNVYNDLEDQLLVKQAAAQGYIIGVADTLDGVRFCLPLSVTQGQITSIAKKYWEDNPQDRHYKASSTIAIAFQKAFPCKKTAPKG